MSTDDLCTGSTGLQRAGSAELLRNWAGNITFHARHLHRPRSVAELQDLVARSSRLHALGTGHSFSPVADTDGDLVRTDALDVPIEIDEQARTVDVPSGTSYGELAVALHRHGLALPNLGSLPHISVGGACATGTHGSGDGNRCLAASAVGVEFVRGDGELVRVTRDDPDFGGSVLALGALGIVTRLTLAVEPTFDVAQQVWTGAPLAGVVDAFDAIMAAGYSVSLFGTLADPGVIDQIWVKTRVDGPQADGRAWGAVAATVPLHPTAGHDAAPVTEQLGVPGPWHERLPHFRASFTPSNGDEQQSEYLLPRVHGAEALARVHALDLRDALISLEIRSVAADELWLSPCHGRDSIGVHVTWRNDDAAVARALAALEATLAPYDPRPHWGKVFALPAESVRAHYPRLSDFAALAERHDPDRVFANAFLDRFVR